MLEIVGSFHVFLTGSLGVIIIEAVKFAAASMDGQVRRNTAKYARGTYWLGVVVLAFVGGTVTAISLGLGPVKAITALQIGINAPAVVTAWATASVAKKRQRRSLGLSPQEVVSAESRSFLINTLELQAW